MPSRDMPLGNGAADGGEGKNRQADKENEPDEIFGDSYPHPSWG